MPAACIGQQALASMQPGFDQPAQSTSLSLRAYGTQGPLLLSMGVLPEVASATSATCALQWSCVASRRCSARWAFLADA